MELRTGADSLCQYQSREDIKSGKQPLDTNCHSETYNTSQLLTQNGGSDRKFKKSRLQYVKCKICVKLEFTLHLHLCLFPNIHVNSFLPHKTSKVLQAFMLYALLLLVRDSIPHPSVPPSHPFILCASLFFSHPPPFSTFFSLTDCPKAAPRRGNWCVCVCLSI